MRIYWTLIIIALAGLADTAANAQEASATSASHPCAAVLEDASRLECYDKTYGRPNRALTPAPVAAAAVVVAKDPADDFGLTLEQQRAQNPVGVPDRGPSSIEAKVAEVRRSGDGQFVVTLENGQVWAQNDPAERVYLQAGEQVTIRKGALGSHLLVSVERGSVRVRRLK